MPRRPALPSRGLPWELRRELLKRPAYERPRGSGRVAAEPQPGYFTLKLARRAVLVPALIWRPCPLILPDRLEATAPGPEQWCEPTERPRALRARIGEEEADPFDVWVRGSDIDAREYAHRMADRNWAVIYAPDSPEANSRKPVNLAAQPSLF
jgi:hypothetical protein